MRWLVLVTVLALGAPAHAACPRTHVWKTYARCLDKQGTSEVLHDSPGAKLVAIAATHRTDTKLLQLHVLASDVWTRASFYAETNPNAELLGISALADGHRIDIGHATRSWIALDDHTSRPALLRRTFSYVCTPAGSCRSALTSCDVLVHGKAIATFRAELRWDGRTLKLRGDDRNTNRYCTVPRTLLESSAP